MKAIYDCDLVVKGGIVKAGDVWELTDEKHSQVVDAGIKFTEVKPPIVKVPVIKKPVKKKVIKRKPTIKKDKK